MYMHGTRTCIHVCTSIMHGILCAHACTYGSWSTKGCTVTCTLDMQCKVRQITYSICQSQCSIVCANCWKHQLVHVHVHVHAVLVEGLTVSRLTVLNGRSFLHGSWSYDISHELSQPLRVKEVDILQSMVLKVKQGACMGMDTFVHAV